MWFMSIQHLTHGLYAVMIQHNDSDTSCMRAVMPAERTIASEAEHTPQQHPQGPLGGTPGAKLTKDKATKFFQSPL